MTEPPNKRIKASGEEFIDLIRECYQIQFSTSKTTEEDQERLSAGVKKIRETLEQIKSSGDISFGPTRTAAKINWGKCLGLMLETGHDNLMALKILTDTLSPGGGLL